MKTEIKLRDSVLETKRFIQVNCRRNGKFGQLAGYTIIDPEDFDMLNEYKWRFDKNGYIITVLNEKRIFIHRMIMKFPPLDIDHRNRDTCNNRKCNLRIATKNQNNRNSIKRKNCTSKFKGVSWYKRDKKWRGHIKYNNKFIHIGYFDDEIEAAKAYDRKAMELDPEFSLTNKMLGLFLY